MSRNTDTFPPLPLVPAAGGPLSKSGTPHTGAASIGPGSGRDPLPIDNSVVAGGRSSPPHPGGPVGDGPSQRRRGATALSSTPSLSTPGPNPTIPPSQSVSPLTLLQTPPPAASPPQTPPEGGGGDRFARQIVERPLLAVVEEVVEEAVPVVGEMLALDATLGPAAIVPEAILTAEALLPAVEAAIGSAWDAITGADAAALVEGANASGPMSRQAVLEELRDRMVQNITREAKEVWAGKPIVKRIRIPPYQLSDEVAKLRNHPRHTNERPPTWSDQQWLAYGKAIDSFAPMSAALVRHTASPHASGSGGSPSTPQAATHPHSVCVGKPHHCEPGTAPTTPPAGQIPPPAPTHQDPSKPRVVQIGSHTVRTTFTSDKLLLNHSQMDGLGVANFFQMWGAQFQDPSHITVAPAVGAITLTSGVSPAAPGGGLGGNVDIVGHVLGFFAVPPNVQHVTNLSVRLNRARELGKIDAAAYAPYTQGGVPSLRALQSVLTGILRPAANSTVLTRITPLLEYARELYDNSFVYAKLFFYAMLVDEFAFLGAAPVAILYPADAGPEFINIAAALYDGETLYSAMINRRFIFTVDRDYDPADLNVLYWLALGGRRIDGTPVAAAAQAAAINRTPHACFVEWAAVPITVLIRAAAPAPPAAAVPTANQLIAFAMKMASSRNEWDSLSRGLYIAADQMGLRQMAHAVPVAGAVPAHQEYLPLKSNLSGKDPYVPAPSDSNFLYRLLDIIPPESRVLNKADVSAWVGQQAAARTRSIVYYTAIQSVATTVAMSGVNLTRQDLESYLGGAGITTLLRTVLDSAINRVSHLAPGSQSHIHLAGRRAFNLWFGVFVEYNLYPNDDWIGQAGSDPAIANRLAGLHMNIPVRLVQPLSLNNWFTTRPLEFGYTAPNPILNFTSEVFTGGPAIAQGWFAHAGSDEYDKQIRGTFPAWLCSYGAIAVNAIFQTRRPAAQPQVGVQTAPCGPNYPQVYWQPPAADADVAQYGWIPELFCFSPCVFTSYRYADELARAPVLTPGMITAAGVRELKAIHDHQSESVGLSIGMQAAHTPNVEIPDLFGSAFAEVLSLAGPSMASPPAAAVPVAAKDTPAAGASSAAPPAP